MSFRLNTKTEAEFIMIDDMLHYAKYMFPLAILGAALDIALGIDYLMIVGIFIGSVMATYKKEEVDAS